MNVEKLIIEAQRGDEEAMNELIKIYFPLVSINTKNFFIIGAEKEDLVQEGLLGLLKAIKYYDPSKTSFNNFAILCIRRQILSAIKSANSKKNMILNEAISNNLISDEYSTLELDFASNNSSPEEIFFSKNKLENFQRFTLINFSELEKKVLEYIIRGYSYKEIAKQLEVSPKSIDNSIQRIRKKAETWLKTYNLN
ncbi:sigma-70 family RNA polymerase sigma factor [Fusobacterium gastrosuis]|uniref:sigma-70 family RNA polymerase sigma factor n=1 Tax=Fusobacterium gastrosuis TaxID=1755100 RepID=UPI00297B2243|nr:sigma-70 family RNA polymerase sigma factor [Fusobacteriaceae bacterium]MDY5712479.1 sigma-70 family RNA polymerase sigma factor [Fusobacterium gastrosuis]